MVKLPTRLAARTAFPPADSVPDLERYLGSENCLASGHILRGDSGGTGPLPPLNGEVPRTQEGKMAAKNCLCLGTHSSEAIVAVQTANLPPAAMFPDPEGKVAARAALPRGTFPEAISAAKADLPPAVKSPDPEGKVAARAALPRDPSPEAIVAVQTAPPPAGTIPDPEGKMVQTTPAPRGQSWATSTALQ